MSIIISDIDHFKKLTILGHQVGDKFNRGRGNPENMREPDIVVDMEVKNFYWCYPMSQKHRP
ncbi:MAG: hypothetical protein IPL71_04585 [Anaerolineales bacterium]|uniref:hypothetical protein n=1 Tax=Candidatus Villigracilis proximus TaxID=3140683 RepID=UPI0031372BB2|nr:hypothetical protein [Anaerolineales bacterium]